MSLEDLMLSEMSKSQKDRYYDSTYLRLPRVVKCRDRVEWWFPGAGGGGMGCYCLMGTVTVYKIKKVW